MRTSVDFLKLGRSGLFGLVLLPELLDLLALLLDFLLLSLHLRAGLILSVFLVLHMIADRVAGYAAQARTDGGTRARMTDGRADNRAGASAESCATEGPFFTR